jgi:putative DNA primase/helicase
MTDTPNLVVEMVEKATKPKVELADARPPEFSDEALAQRFAERHGDELRYIAAWSRWYAWTGAQWVLDTTLDAFDRARAICRAAAADPDAKGRTKTDLTSAKTVAATERLAKSDRRIAATVDQWDADPDTFNTEAMSHDNQSS